MSTIWWWGKYNWKFTRKETNLKETFTEKIQHLDSNVFWRSRKTLEQKVITVSLRNIGMELCKQGTKSPFKMAKTELHVNCFAVNWLKLLPFKHFLFQIQCPFQRKQWFSIFCCMLYVIKDDLNARKSLLKLNLMNTPPITITFSFLVAVLDRRKKFQHLPF